MNVYLVGTPYSGSTLLGNALGGHPLVLHAGELSRLPRFGLGPPATECTLCRVLGRRCPLWGAATVELVESAGAGGALPALRRATGAAAIVDSSKHVEWLRWAARDGGLPAPARVLLTVRHPFAFATSMMRTDGVAAWQAANVWRDTVFDALRELGRQGIPFMVVRYEDFARDPEPVLRRACDFAGLDYDAGCMHFWDAEAHVLGGNPHAYVWYDGFCDKVDYAREFAADRAIARDFRARQFGGWVDERWRNELGDSDRLEIAATPSLPNLAHIVGYAL